MSAEKDERGRKKKGLHLDIYLSYHLYIFCLYRKNIATSDDIQIRLHTEIYLGINLTIRDTSVYLSSERN